MRIAYRWVGALAVVLALGLVALILLALLGRGATSERADRPTSTTSPTGATGATGAPDGTLVQVVGVVDGDTLRVSVEGTTLRLRIIGIDAPELRGDECLAQESSSLMQRLVQSRTVRVTADDTQADRDVFDRLLRHVWLPDGRSVGAEMLTAGLATEYTYAAPYRGVEEYRAAEDEARAAGRGVWGEGCSDSVPTPAPATGSAVAPPTEGCDIKGNINAEGERIYHVPGQRDYEATRISSGTGERWFCTEEDAHDAGWRKAQR